MVRVRDLNCLSCESVCAEMLNSKLEAAGNCLSFTPEQNTVAIV